MGQCNSSEPKGDSKPGESSHVSTKQNASPEAHSNHGAGSSASLGVGAASSRRSSGGLTLTGGDSGRAFVATDGRESQCAQKGSHTALFELSGANSNSSPTTAKFSGGGPHRGLGGVDRFDSASNTGGGYGGWDESRNQSFSSIPMGPRNDTLVYEPSPMLFSSRKPNFPQACAETPAQSEAGAPSRPRSLIGGASPSNSQHQAPNLIAPLVISHRRKNKNIQRQKEQHQQLPTSAEGTFFLRPDLADDQRDIDNQQRGEDGNPQELMVNADEDETSTETHVGDGDCSSVEPRSGGGSERRKKEATRERSGQPSEEKELSHSPCGRERTLTGGELKCGEHEESCHLETVKSWLTTVTSDADFLNETGSVTRAGSFQYSGPGGITGSTTDGSSSHFTANQRQTSTLSGMGGIEQSRSISFGPGGGLGLRQISTISAEMSPGCSVTIAVGALREPSSNGGVNGAEATAATAAAEETVDPWDPANFTPGLSVLPTNVS